MIKQIFASLMMLTAYNTQPIYEKVDEEYSNTNYDVALWDWVTPTTEQDGYKILNTYTETDDTEYINTIQKQYKKYKYPTMHLSETQTNGYETYGFDSYYLKTQGYGRMLNNKINLKLFGSMTITNLEPNPTTPMDIYLNVIVYTSQEGSIEQYITNPSEIENSSYTYSKKIYQQYYTQNSEHHLQYDINKQLVIDIPVAYMEDTETIIYIYPELKVLNNTSLRVPLSFNYSTTWLVTENTNITGTYQTFITTEVIDIPNIMWTVLTMPFTFISIAFNLTLFPGTQYAVNIGNLILALLGIMVFVFLMSIIIKAAAKSQG